MEKFSFYDGSEVEAASFDAAYAEKYDCSIAEAIADRDEPQTREDLISRFFKAAGRVPTENEIKIMHPESKEICDAFFQEQKGG